VVATIAALSTGAPAQAQFEQRQAPYADDSLIVAFEPGANTRDARSGLDELGAAATRRTSERTALVKLKPGQTVKQVARRLARRSDVSFVKPNYLARVSDAFVPDDPGKGGGWQELQWNFEGPFGVNALSAWGRMRDLGREGGSGAVVAVVDTGVAYQNVGRYRVSPDLAGVKIVSPYDFVDNDRRANDQNGHGTHVASTIVEQTNNGVGVAGLAYGASLMPLRALDGAGFGDEYTMARAIRYAAKRGADVINLSLEFDLSLRRRDLPLILGAIRYARSKGALVVGAAGNQGAARVAYPAKSSDALAVGATTRRGCLAEYSDWGSGLDLVAPGGGNDYLAWDTRDGSTDPLNCNLRGIGSPVYQMTFTSGLRSFGLPGGYVGTSMATPHVSAAAALVIASGVVGEDPTPQDVAIQLTQTARDLGMPGKDRRYGNGLVDAGAAVAP
jgi:serine protease